MNRTLAGGVAVVVVAAAALVAGVLVGRSGSQEPSAAAVFALALPDVDGREQRIEQWRGKVVVVNFWATWCEPCRTEMPEFVRAQSASGGKGLQFVGIAIDQPDKIRQFSQDLKLNYPSLIGGYGALELSKTLGNTLMALPFTVIIDRAGQVAYVQTGPLKPGKLDAIVSKLL